MLSAKGPGIYLSVPVYQIIPYLGRKLDPKPETHLGGLVTYGTSRVSGTCLRCILVHHRGNHGASESSARTALGLGCISFNLEYLPDPMGSDTAEG